MNSNRTDAGKILIAEPDRMVSLFLERALAHEGYRVLRACTGREARVLFKHALS